MSRLQKGMHTLCNNKDKPKNYYYFCVYGWQLWLGVEWGWGYVATKGCSTHTNINKESPGF